MVAAPADDERSQLTGVGAGAAPAAEPLSTPEIPLCCES